MRHASFIRQVSPCLAGAVALAVSIVALAAEPVASPPATQPPAAQAPGGLNVALISQGELLERLEANDSTLFLLDVRSPEEFAAGHIAGAVNIPYDQIAAHRADVPTDKDVVLYCRSGRRSGLAAEVLAANGYERLEHLDGDIQAWVAQGRPVTTTGDAAPAH